MLDLFFDENGVLKNHLNRVRSSHIISCSNLNKKEQQNWRLEPTIRHRSPCRHLLNEIEIIKSSDCVGAQRRRCRELPIV